MNRNEFDTYPAADKSESEIRCFFPWGWAPSATIDIRWNKISIPIINNSGMFNVSRNEVVCSGFTDAFKDWACENINTRWVPHNKINNGKLDVYFENEDDAMLFKLTWS